MRLSVVRVPIEEAVKWRLFQETIGEVRQAFAQVPAADLVSLLTEARHSVRNDKKRGRKARSRR